MQNAIKISDFQTTMGVNLPELQFTPLDDIPKRVSITRQAFLDHKTRDVEFRLIQLRKLYWA
jgi:beta-apo-4'-carotenal oxygenase